MILAYIHISCKRKKNWQKNKPVCNTTAGPKMRCRIIFWCVVVASAAAKLIYSAWVKPTSKKENSSLWSPRYNGLINKNRTSEFSFILNLISFNKLVIAFFATTLLKGTEHVNSLIGKGLIITNTRIDNYPNSACHSCDAISPISVVRPL